MTGKRKRPTGRVVDESEVLRVRVFFDDGTSAYIPFMAVGRRIIRFEVNEWIYAPMLRRDFDDLDALE